MLRDTSVVGSRKLRISGFPSISRTIYANIMTHDEDLLSLKDSSLLVYKRQKVPMWPAQVSP